MTSRSNSHYGPRRGRVRDTLRRRGLLPRPRVLRALSRLAENLPTHGNSLDIYYHGESLYDHMIKDIDSARERVCLEMYIFAADATGRRFARALSRAARRGVRVRVAYDALGCFAVPSSFFGVLAESGVEVIEYHPIAPWRKRFALLERNHRKNLIVILAGYENEVSGQWAAAISGRNQNVSGLSGTVLGGYGNMASGTRATVVGGRYNEASGYAALTLGGAGNDSTDEVQVVVP